MSSHRLPTLWSCLLGLLGVSSLLAEDAIFYSLTVDQLQYEAEKPPGKLKTLKFRQAWRQQAMRPYVIAADQETEFFISGTTAPGHAEPFHRVRLYVKALHNKDVRGELVVPKSDWSEMVRLPFRIPANERLEMAQAFYRQQERHYQQLLKQGVSGAAWHRRKMLEAQEKRGRKQDVLPQVGSGGARSQWERMIGFASGARAMEENLQLRRNLSVNAQQKNEWRSLDSLTGITVPEIDWKPFVKDIDPQLDPLSAYLPADQHAIFFASPSALAAVFERGFRLSAPAITATVRSEDTAALQRYQTQLGVSLPEFLQWEQTFELADIAMTGSDLYLEEGSDIALLMQTKKAKKLVQKIQANYRKLVEDGQAEEVQGKLEGHTYHGVRSRDRRVSSYLVRMGSTVAISNSLPQLRRLVRTEAKLEPSLKSLPEFHFFRNRYSLADQNELAFIMMTDAAIRRWCGPRWRIGMARRALAAEVMAELQARHHDQLAGGGDFPQVLSSDWNIPELGELSLTADGVESSVYGAVGRLTPIIELPIDQVTTAEHNAYQNWRTGYQRLWRVFDPIGIRLSDSSGGLAMDMTVMPLRLGSQYNFLRAVTQGGILDPNTGDLHPKTLFHAIAKVGKQWVNPVGVSQIELYVDNDAYWKKLARAEDPNEYAKENPTPPIAIVATAPEGGDGEKILKLLGGLINRKAIEEAEQLEHKGVKYYRADRLEPSLDAPSYYTSIDELAIVTFNEALIQRFIERRTSPKVERKAAAKTSPWLGESFAVKLHPAALEMVEEFARRDYQHFLAAQSWGNLAILNQWKRRYPKLDPTELHQRIWRTRPVCPGGGQYVWNEQWKTMESTVFGHPAQPKFPEKPPKMLPGVKQLEFGVTLEPQGLRARAAAVGKKQ